MSIVAKVGRGRGRGRELKSGVKRSGESDGSDRDEKGFHYHRSLWWELHSRLETPDCSRP